MAKRMKENKNKGKWKVFLIVIAIITIITVIFCLNKDILPKKMKQENELNKEKVQYKQVVEEKYVIKDYENFSFHNAEIKTENNISYINIEVKNNNLEKSLKKEIIIHLYCKNKQMQMAYTIPEIEAGSNYKMQLNVMTDLSDIESIEIKSPNI